MNSDIFCLSSIYEGLPISLIEAFAYGCIPVCTPAGGIADIIKTGENGYLSESFSPEDYYRVLLKYLAEKDRIPKTALIEFYHQFFSIEICAQKHLKAYHEQIKKN